MIKKIIWFVLNFHTRYNHLLKYLIYNKWEKGTNKQKNLEYSDFMHHSVLL